MKGIRRISIGSRDNPKILERPYYTVDELKEGYLYRIVARNARIGIWTPKYNGFHISRFKFDRNYLFVEIHWDLSDDFGTVLPIEEIEPTPFKIGWLKDWHTKRSIQRNVLEYLNRKAKELREK